MQEIQKIGVDVGNFNTKTQHCSFPSGYQTYNTRPAMPGQILEYNGEFYSPSAEDRMTYVIDKTQNDQCLILTLLGIAEELLYVAKNGESGDIQAELDILKEVKLGVGLPPGHYNSFAKKTIKYYEEKLASKPISFTYNDYKFNFILNTIRLFPQDFLAVYKNPTCTTAKKSKYYIIGIGGGTVDIVPVIDFKPDVNNCFSLEAGTRMMFAKIAKNLQVLSAEFYQESVIENFLRGKETYFTDEEKGIIRKTAKAHLDEIIKGLKQHGINIKAFPCVFYGGGGLLLKEFIENYPDLHYEILEDVNANAKAYAANLK